MLLIQKMYLKDFLTTLAVLTLGIGVIFSIIGLIDKIDEFMPHKPPFNLLVSYAIYSMPRYTQYLLPMAVLLSSLFIFSQAIRRREIVVIKSAGGKLRKLLRPFIILGVMLTLASFLLGEIVVPYAAKQLRAIANQITKKERRVTFKEGTVYMRGRDGSVMRVGLYLPDREAYQDVTIFRFNADGLRERIDAKSANWGKDERWHFNDVRTLDLKAGKLTKTPELALSGIDSPRIFQEEAWKVEELSVMELNSYKNRLQDAGFKNIKLLVDISSRVAYPIINLFMLLLGISLSVGSDQHLLQRIYQLRAFQNVESHGGVVSAGIGLLISLIYWFGYSFFLSLGYAGTLPPAVSPWIVPVAFSLLTAHLFRNIPE